MVPDGFKPLFTKANYTFSTSDPGRLTTFYFRDPLGNMGRIRREHDGRPMVAYQGPSKRIFISKPGRKDFSKFIALKPTYDQADEDSDFFWAGPEDMAPTDGGDNFERLAALIDQISGGGGSLLGGKVSVRPITNWHLFDFLETTGVSHGSKGAIVDSDPDATDANIRSLLSQAVIPCHDWTTDSYF